jgi:hypothetical protein
VKMPIATGGFPGCDALATGLRQAGFSAEGGAPDDALTARICGTTRERIVLTQYNDTSKTYTRSAHPQATVSPDLEELGGGQPPGLQPRRNSMHRWPITRREGLLPRSDGSCFSPMLEEFPPLEILSIIRT